MKITHASRLTNSELISEVGRLAHGEREATVALIVHLAEFDARHLFAGAGFSSTFTYCVEVLRLSEDAAFNRIQAGRSGALVRLPRRLVDRGLGHSTTP